MTLTRRNLLLAAAAASAIAPARAQGLGRLVPTGGMLSPRATHNAVRLSNGAVIVLGGFAVEGQGLTPMERFDPSAGRFARFGALSMPRIQALAVAVPGDRILVMGGVWNETRSSAEIVAPDGTTRAVPEMSDRRTAAAAIPLRDGRILIAGGSAPGYRMTATAEIFDPQTLRFRPVAPMTEARAGHAMAMLPSGRVLVTGGGEGGRIAASAEIFDPATSRFRAIARMRKERFKHAAIPLDNGDVLIVGGSDDRSGPDGRGRLAACERFDAKTEAFSAAPHLNHARYKIGDAVVRSQSGAIVVAGGNIEPEALPRGGRAFELIAGRYDAQREFMTATPLGGGRALVCGGYDQNIRAGSGAWLLEA